MTEQSPENKKSKRKAPHPLFRLLDFAGPYKILTVVGCALSGLHSLLAVMPLVCVWFIMSQFVAVAPQWSEASGAAFYAWLAVGFAVAGVVVYFAALMCTHIAAFRTGNNMRKAATHHLSKVPLGYYDEHSTGELRRVIDGCAGQTEDVIAHKMPDFIASCTAPVAFLVAMFLFDWVMGLVCLIPVAVSLFAMWWMMGRDVPEGGRFFMQRYQEALNRMSTAATEYVRGIPVVKVFQQTVHSFKAFHAAIIDYRDMATQYVNFCRLPQVVQLVAINGTFAVLVPAAILLAASAGDFARFLTDFLFYVVFSAFTTTVMSKIMYASEALMMAEDSVRRVNEILAVEPMEEVRSEAAEHVSDASVALRGVTFSYPGAAVPAVRDVTLEVPAGATVALVGPSGGGKSTIANLLARLWDVKSGSVTIRGVDTRQVPLAELMDHISMVFQRVYLFQDTIYNNISMGKPNATEEEVYEAARKARCYDFIMALPDGFQTVVGEGGATLSGGEKQRISIARCILKDAPIVILDEATASVDTDNESYIQEAISELVKGKTLLVIAHRLNTIQNADQILVISDGRISQHGTHEELMEQPGIYQDFVHIRMNSAGWSLS